MDWGVGNIFILHIVLQTTFLILIKKISCGIFWYGLQLFQKHICEKHSTLFWTFEGEWEKLKFEFESKSDTIHSTHFEVWILQRNPYTFFFLVTWHEGLHHFPRVQYVQKPWIIMHLSDAAAFCMTCFLLLHDHPWVYRIESHAYITCWLQFLQFCESTICWGRWTHEWELKRGKKKTKQDLMLTTFNMVGRSVVQLFWATKVWTTWWNLVENWRLYLMRIPVPY